LIYLWQEYGESPPESVSLDALDLKSFLHEGINVFWEEVSYGTIVVATDGSPSSLEGARHAIVLAKMSSARLRVINVIDASAAIQPYANNRVNMQGRSGQRMTESLGFEAVMMAQEK
jgi:hypothetical protein